MDAPDALTARRPRSIGSVGSVILLSVVIAGLLVLVMLLAESMHGRNVIARESPPGDMWAQLFLSVSTGAFMGAAAAVAAFVYGASRGRRFALKWCLLHFAAAFVAYAVVETVMREVRTDIVRMMILDDIVRRRLGDWAFWKVYPLVWALQSVSFAAPLVAVGLTARWMKRAVCSLPDGSPV